MKNLRILVAPSGFKESLEADEVADCVAMGIHQALPEAEIFKAPFVDGGEGFTRALVNVTGGTLHSAIVTGPVGKPVEACFGFLGGQGKKKIAVLEMAAAAGLRLVPLDQRDPGKTSSYGVGELIRAALDAGAERILIGCGDSGINDGGAGMAQALGIQLLDEEGKELKQGGYCLRELKHIDFSNQDPRLKAVSIDVACNWNNVLCGPFGVARVFGPQKGASSEAVEQLAAALDHYADIIHQQMNLDVRTLPGSGASGGLGTGLFALLGATLHPRFDIILKYLDLDALLNQVDLVITAEGGLDALTPLNKVPAEVATRAKRLGLPVIALAGTVGRDARINLEFGIDAYVSILERPCGLQEAFDEGRDLLIRASEQAMRMILVGYRLKSLNKSHDHNFQKINKTKPFYQTDEEDLILIAETGSIT